MANDTKLKDHIAALEREGYVIRKKRNRTKTHTFIVEVDTLNTFKITATKRNTTLRQAIHEAMTLWLDKYRKN
jgi:hypothetical protein